MSKKSILGLEKPVIALSPMDGVTDFPFRYITKKYGNPDLIFTEFTHVHGLCVAGQNLLQHFEYSEIERPVVAQIYGHEPEYFYHAAKIVVAMGFDAVDINMGCPATKVSSRGAGAGLIRTPDLAREIVAEVKRGVADWVADGKLTGLAPKAQKAVENKIEEYRMRIEPITSIYSPPLAARLATGQGEDQGGVERSNPEKIIPPLEGRLGGVSNLLNQRSLIPVSVKTRIGYDVPITESWIKNLEKANPAWISVHGRTLKQMYSGKADIEELKKAVESTDLAVMINGDIDSIERANEVMNYTGAFGALIGRASFGNPWVFQIPPLERGLGGVTADSYTLTHPNPPLREGGTLNEKEIIKVMLEHARIFDEFNKLPDGTSNEKAFVQMRKHFAWYTKQLTVDSSQFSDREKEVEYNRKIKELRMKLVRVKSLEEVEGIVDSMVVG